MENSTAAAAIPLPARYTFADLVHAEVNLDLFNDSARYVELYDPRQRYFGTPAWEAWREECLKIGRRRHELLADIEAELAKVRHMICAKCGGRGEHPQWRHRLGGVCYPCHGSGWKAKYRRQASR